METISKKTIGETLKAAEEYVLNLEELLSAASEVAHQIDSSSKIAIKLIEDTLESLTITFVKIIALRKSELLRTIEQMTRRCLLPITMSQTDLTKKLSLGNELIVNAKKVLKSGGFSSEEACNDFLNKSSHLGVLPVLPEMELIPQITFQASPDSLVKEFQSKIQSFGVLSEIGPTQITTMEARPGALLVAWDDVVDTDANYHETKHYCLQIVDHSVWSQTEDETFFRDIYVGTERSYLVKDLKKNKEYSFRVNCRMDESAHWSAWGRIRTSSTDLEHFRWESNNGAYVVSDNSRLASMNTPGHALFSHGAQIENGHVIKFTLSNSSHIEDGEGLALVPNKKDNLHPQSANVFFVSFLGHVFIDGMKKIIQLPQVTNNQSMTFVCEKLNNKWRITVEIDLKAVTYEWNEPAENLFFALLLKNSDTQLLVE